MAHEIIEPELAPIFLTGETTPNHDHAVPINSTQALGSTVLEFRSINSQNVDVTGQPTDRRMATAAARHPNFSSPNYEEVDYFDAPQPTIKPFEPDNESSLD